MNTDRETPTVSPLPAAVHAQPPSADFIQAISDFLDTDPNDLLMELGYYTRDDQSAGADSAEVAA